VHKFLNLKNYARFTFRVINHYVLGSLEICMGPNPDSPLRHPPIFLVGAPRSGSTLAVQVITDTLDVGYISNRHCKWFGAPALAERLFRPTKNWGRSDFKSKEGTTNGSYAPAECGEWWYRFFRRNPPYMTLEDVCPVRMRRFRRSVAALTNEFDRPIVFKNLYASLRIQAIAHYLPESLFIVVRRNEIDNGHSLLEARYRRFNDYTRWFSVEPPEIERLKKLPAHQQVIEQIRHTYKTIDSDFRVAQINGARRFDLVYEDFCDSPARTLTKLQEFLLRHNCIVSQRAEAPQKFHPRREVRIDSDIHQKMISYVEQNI
jgi:hypothetical protein